MKLITNACVYHESSPRALLWFWCCQPVATEYFICAIKLIQTECVCLPWPWPFNQWDVLFNLLQCGWAPIFLFHFLMKIYRCRSKFNWFIERNMYVYKYTAAIEPRTFPGSCLSMQTLCFHLINTLNMCSAVLRCVCTLHTGCCSRSHHIYSFEI